MAEATDQTETAPEPSYSVDDISPETQALLDGMDSDVDDTLDLSQFDDEDSEGAVAEDTEEVVAEDAAEDEPAEEKTDRYSQALKKLSRKERELAAKEAEIKERYSRIENVEKHAEAYRSDPLGVLRSMVGALEDTDDESVIDDAIVDLHNKLTMEILGIDAPPELKEASQYEKLQREFERYKQEQEAKERHLQEEAERMQALQQRQQNINMVGNFLAEQKDQYPVLLNHPDYDAPSLVYQTIEADYMSQLEAGIESPKELTIDEAAASIEEQLRNEAQKWASLFPNDNNSKKQSTGRTAINRPAATKSLNNTNTVAAPARQAKDAYIDDEEESIRRSIAMIREI